MDKLAIAWITIGLFSFGFFYQSLRKEYKELKREVTFGTLVLVVVGWPISWGEYIREKSDE